MASALHSQRRMTTIDVNALAGVCGGANGPPQPQPQPEPPPRTWGQVAADYTAACVQRATDATIFQGRPSSWQQLAITAGVGCAMGLANQAAQDWSRSAGKP